MLVSVMGETERSDAISCISIESPRCQRLLIHEKVRREYR